MTHETIRSRRSLACDSVWLRRLKTCGFVLVCGAVATGCIGTTSGSVVPRKTATKESSPESNRLFTKSGSATVREPGGNRHILYTVRWKSSQLDYTLEGGAVSGQLQGVEGKLYREGKLGSRFTAEAAIADKEKGILILDGKVSVIGVDPQAKLDCQKLEWKTQQKQLRAIGGVTIRFNQGTIGPTDELWCLPDLKRAGTPGFSH